MVVVSDLQQIYNPSYFGVVTDKYIWEEKQTDSTALSSIEFVFTGGTISYVKSDLLKNLQNAFRTDSTKTLNLRKICDGLLFLDRGDEHYFIILEVKSGFNEVKNKAVSQIPASYVKAKSILNDFKTYNNIEYKEFGLIVSYPYVVIPMTDSENNSVVMRYKREMVGDKNEIITSKYSKLLKDAHSATFLGSDFEFDKLTGVKQELFFDTLSVKHYPVDNHCVNAKIDLDDVIRSL